ncbi:DUF983 domain-containing protein [uncultured Lentibacter sp.]|uniref:DUF983 domain-containing protein n=1 Tax=uncultured Lentibacter sp. TaxID=1659309 RepID=UPI0026325E98|nr:DUF983 domain-containing protein [uncultured Lentibacter sp.]
MPQTNQTLVQSHAPAPSHAPAQPERPEAERPLKSALLRGWRRKCPHCGTGPLLKGYLKVHSDCAVCGEDFTPQRADDGPAYLTILVVGHVMIPLLHIAFVLYRPEPLALFTIFALGTTALTLYLLPRMKGAVIGFQWARRMHGFDRPV